MSAADKELLVLAARAARYDVNFDEPVNDWYPHGYDEHGDVSKWWNPLMDDGDALRLAVKLGIQIWRRPSGVEGIHKGSVLTSPQTEPLLPDPYAATRCAIVRAAAAIGETA